MTVVILVPAVEDRGLGRSTIHLTTEMVELDMSALLVKLGYSTKDGQDRIMNILRTDGFQHPEHQNVWIMPAAILSVIE